MTQAVLKNFASSTLASSITDSDTEITIQGGDASKFPSPSGGDWAPVVVVDAEGNREIMKCTARASAVLTVVRGQEGTSALAWDAGDRIDVRATTAVYDQFAPLDSPAFTGSPTAPTQLQADSSTKVATTAYVRAAVSAILNGVSSAFDTLSEIATALGTKLAISSNLSDVASAATAFANIKQAATESATGVVELATTAEAATGTDTERAVTPAGLKAVGDTKETLGFVTGIRTLTDNGDMAAADVGKIVEMNASTSKTYSIKANADIAIAINGYINFTNIGTGSFVIDAPSGVTLSGTDGGSFTLEPGEGATIYKRGTDAWYAPNMTVA